MLFLETQGNVVYMYKAFASYRYVQFKVNMVGLHFIDRINKLKQCLFALLCTGMCSGVCLCLFISVLGGLANV